MSLWAKTATLLVLYIPTYHQTLKYENYGLRWCDLTPLTFIPLSILWMLTHKCDGDMMSKIKRWRLRTDISPLRRSGQLKVCHDNPCVCRVGIGRLRSASVALQSCREGKKGLFVRRHNFPFSQKSHWKIRVTQLGKTLSFSHQSTRGRKNRALSQHRSWIFYILAFSWLLNKHDYERQWWSEV